MAENVPVIRCEVQGKGRPVVLLHAYPFSKYLFHRIESPPGCRLILPDFPGFGDSPPGDRGLTLTQAAMGLGMAIYKLGIREPFTIGGVSMGGYWAMEFLSLFPDMVARILLAATKPGLDDEKVLSARLAVAERVWNDGSEFLVPVMTPNLLSPTHYKSLPSLVDKVQASIRMASREGIACAQRAMASRKDQTETLRHLKVPGLWLAGEEDVLIPLAEARTYAALNSLIRLEVIEKTGHLVPFESPEDFQKHLNAFVQA